MQYSMSKQLKVPSRRRSVHLGALFASVLSLAGCATAAVHPGGAASPMDAQASMATKDANHYPAIHDMPPQRTEPLISPAEEARIRSDLIAARDRQARAAVAKKK